MADPYRKPPDHTRARRAHPSLAPQSTWFAMGCLFAGHILMGADDEPWMLLAALGGALLVFTRAR